jgi:hypothetical protein
MTTNLNNSGKAILERIARRVMTERGFLVDFSEAALKELEKIAYTAWGRNLPGRTCATCSGHRLTTMIPLTWIN